MAKPLDIAALLRRGGDMTRDETKQLARELTEAKLSEMAVGASERSLDQPVKVIPFTQHPPKSVSGYFTQQKFIWGKTPEQMEAILGIFGKLCQGACILQFEMPLNITDFENRAYSYLPDGREYTPDPKETVYLPGKGAPQWLLTHEVQARCIARLPPGESFNKTTLVLSQTFTL